MENSNFGQHGRELQYEDRRLCLRNITLDTTSHEIRRLLSDFPDVNIYFPDNTKVNQKRLAFIDFPKPWEANVARKLINLIRYKNIIADFSIKNTKIVAKDIKIPGLVDRCTLFPYPKDDAVPESGRCAHCDSLDARFVCEVCFTLYCGTFYCNKDHQNRDWPRHKYDCKMLPKLVLPSEAAEAIRNEVAVNAALKAKKKFHVPSIDAPLINDSVVITHVASERVLFVRPLKVDREFQELLDMIKKNAENAPNLTENPDIDDVCLALVNGEQERVQILDIQVDSDDKEIYSTFLLDRGQTVRLTSSQNITVHGRNVQVPTFKHLSYRQRGRQRHTIKVILDDVKVDSTPNIREYLDQLCKNQTELQVVELNLRGEDRFVVLQIPGSLETLNEHIRAGTKVSMQNDERIMFDESNIMKLPTGENIKLRVTDVTNVADGFISCMSADAYNVFWKKSLELNDYGNSKAPELVHEPIVNELCLVKYEKRWERAAVVEINNEDVQMILVDQFALRLVSKQDIRKLPCNFATSYFAQLCFIEDFKENLNTAIEPRKIIVAASARFDDGKNCYAISLSKP